jgi:SanA protein
MKKWFYISMVFMAAMFVAVLYSNLAVSRGAAPYVKNRLAELPVQKVGVLLGTSQFLSNGHKNMYFEFRMNAAAELYNAGKVQYILVSGDNRKRNYNEPVAMQAALMKRGVPEDRIVLDYAGFRTLDSMVRAREVFGQTRFVVISQKFHNERAVFIARQKGIDAYGYNARDVQVSAGFKTRVREVLARTKMMLDLYILRTQPHFLGEEVKIGE